MSCPNQTTLCCFNIMYSSDPGYYLRTDVPSSLSVQLWCLLPCDAVFDPPCKIQAGCLLSSLPSLHAILSMLSYPFPEFPTLRWVSWSFISALWQKSKEDHVIINFYFWCGCLCLEPHSFLWRSPVDLLRPISFIMSPTSFLISFFPKLQKCQKFWRTFHPLLVPL